MEYAIMTSYNISDLTKVVSNAISVGWKPQGGVSMILQSDGSTFCAQAMVKTK